MVLEVLASLSGLRLLKNFRTLFRPPVSRRPFTVLTQANSPARSNRSSNSGIHHLRDAKDESLNVLFLLPVDSRHHCRTYLRPGVFFTCGRRFTERARYQKRRSRAYIHHVSFSAPCHAFPVPAKDLYISEGCLWALSLMLVQNFLRIVCTFATITIRFHQCGWQGRGYARSFRVCLLCRIRPKSIGVLISFAYHSRTDSIMMNSYLL